MSCNEMENMDKYFLLGNKTNFLCGEKTVVLYDFEHNRSFHLHEEESEILKDVSLGKSINSISEKFGKIKTAEFLALLASEKLGTYNDSFVPKETYRKGRLKRLYLEENMMLNDFFLEMPFGCNKSCAHCKTPKINGCMTCSLPNSRQVEENIDIEYYFSILRQVISLGCHNIYIHGGAPLEYWPITKRILEFLFRIKTEKQNVFLITNGNSFNKEIVDFMIGYEIKPIIVLDFTSGWEKKMDNTIKELFNFFGEHDYEIDFNIILDFENKDNEEIYSYLLNKSISRYSVSIVIQSENSIDYSAKMPLFTADIETYRWLETFHPCMAGRLAMNTEKEIIPCPRMTSEVITDLECDNLLIYVFENCIEELQKYWELSTEKIEPCNKCEYRRLCLDCRAVELLYTNDLNKKHTCSYQGTLSI